MQTSVVPTGTSLSLISRAAVVSTWLKHQTSLTQSLPQEVVTEQFKSDEEKYKVDGTGVDTPAWPGLAVIHGGISQQFIGHSHKMLLQTWLTCIQVTWLQQISTIASQTLSNCKWRNIKVHQNQQEAPEQKLQWFQPAFTVADGRHKKDSLPTDPKLQPNEIHPQWWAAPPPPRSLCSAQVMLQLRLLGPEKVRVGIAVTSWCRDRCSRDEAAKDRWRRTVCVCLCVRGGGVLGRS